MSGEFAPDSPRLTAPSCGHFYRVFGRHNRGVAGKVNEFDGDLGLRIGAGG